MKGEIPYMACAAYNLLLWGICTCSIWEASIMEENPILSTDSLVLDGTTIGIASDEPADSSSNK